MRATKLNLKIKKNLPLSSLGIFSFEYISFEQFLCILWGLLTTFLMKHFKKILSTDKLWFAVYHCGSEQGWSDLFYFKTPPAGDDWQPSLAIYGDLGNENAQSLSRLQEETQRGMYDAILHVGDFAYDMDSVSYFFNLLYEV